VTASPSPLRRLLIGTADPHLVDDGLVAEDFEETIAALEEIDPG
jgi:hypothetical protein